VVVFSQVICAGRAWMAKLDLDGGVPDIEFLAESRLQLPQHAPSDQSVSASTKETTPPEQGPCSQYRSRYQ
jgi:hypothetical protein